MSYQDVETLRANREMVVDLTDHLRVAFEGFINHNKRDVPYMDAFMAAHNFHKFIVFDIVSRMEQMPPEGKAMFLKMAVDTFARAVDAEIEKKNYKLDVFGIKIKTDPNLGPDEFRLEK